MPGKTVCFEGAKHSSQVVVDAAFRNASKGILAPMGRKKRHEDPVRSTTPWTNADGFPCALLKYVEAVCQPLVHELCNPWHANRASLLSYLFGWFWVCKLGSGLLHTQMRRQKGRTSFGSEPKLLINGWIPTLRITICQVGGCASFLIS